MRSYGQMCGLALALDRIGERWALLVVRELLAGPKRFADLLEGLPNVATNTLTTRLQELEASGIIARRKLPPPAASWVYELTERGRALEPVLLAFARWGEAEIHAAWASPERAASLAPVRSEWLGLALRAFFSPPDRRISGRLALEMRTGTLGIAVEGGVLDLSAGPMPDAQARLVTGEEVAVALLIGKQTLKSALKSGQATLEGRAEVAERLLSCFPLAHSEMLQS